MIANDAQLATAIAEVGRRLQEVSDYLQTNPSASGQVRFPRGVLRTAAYFRTRLSFIADDNLRRNISYAFMLYDVFKWILTRTDLAGTARDMVLKNAIVLIGSIAESLARGGTAGIIGAKHNYKERTRRMVEAGIVTGDQKLELDWLWDTRGGIHIYLMENSEFDHYRIEHFERAKRAAGDLRDALETYHAALAS